VQKTKLALRQSLLALLARKAWDEISIQELCEQGNVGRSTFYLHFQSKEALLCEGLADLGNFLATQSLSEPGRSLPFLRGLLEHMAEQRAAFRAVIGRRSGHGVVLRFKDLVVQLVQTELRRQHPIAAGHAWLIHYLAGGIVEAMSWWVDAPKPPPIRELERQMDDVAARVLAGLQAGA